MDTLLNPVTVPGWADLVAEHPTRALTLQALTNLELAYHLGQSLRRPTRKTILAEVIRLGADLSSASLQTIQRHLDTLVKSGHLIIPPDCQAHRGRSVSPWRSRYVGLKEKQP